MVDTVQVSTFPSEGAASENMPLDVFAALLQESGGFTNLVATLLAGKKVAWGVTAVTGTQDIATGLATVEAVVVSASSDPDGTALASVSGVITGAAGHFTAKCWKITAADNGALIAATAAKNVSWIAMGT